MKIGILGGSFDPAHKGHLAISKEAKKRFKLEKIIWAVTKKNPLKSESKIPITKKIKDCKKVIGLNSFIKVKFYENIIKSNKTIDLINHLKKNHSEINYTITVEQILLGTGGAIKLCSKNFTKEEKEDLIHIAICKVLSLSGYYQLMGTDKEGWPHWENVQAIPSLPLKEQELLLKAHVIHYFKTEVFPNEDH